MSRHLASVSQSVGHQASHVREHGHRPPHSTTLHNLPGDMLSCDALPAPHLHAAGCIPNDYWDMGVAVGPLNVPPGVYYPVKLVITGWSDGSSVSSGP